VELMGLELIPTMALLTVDTVRVLLMGSLKNACFKASTKISLTIKISKISRR
jgi:hypothetical protein